MTAQSIKVKDATQAQLMKSIREFEKHCSLYVNGDNKN